MLIENPAARLLEILEQGKKKSLNGSCHETWQMLLKTQNMPDSTLFVRLGKVMALPSEIMVQFEHLNASDRQKNSIHSCMANVNVGFKKQNLLLDWNSFISHINEPAMDSLDFVSDLFKHQPNITSGDHSQELSQIKETLQTLLNNILEQEDLDEEIKKFLVRSLQRIIIAIDEYFISGYVPIIEAIETIMGHAALDARTENKEFCSALKTTGAGDKLMDALNILSTIVTLTIGVPQITEGFVQYLLSVK